MPAYGNKHLHREVSPAVQHFEQFLQTRLLALQDDLMTHFEENFQRKCGGAAVNEKDIGKDLAKGNLVDFAEEFDGCNEITTRANLPSLSGTSPKIKEIQNSASFTSNCSGMDDKQKEAEEEEMEVVQDITQRVGNLNYSRSTVDKQHMELIRTQSAGLFKKVMLRSMPRITKTSPYQIVIGFIIIFNSVFIGWQVDHQVRYGSELEFDVFLSYGFCIIFTVDILLRLSEEWEQFFFGEEKYWNAFESFLLLLMLWEVADRISTRAALVQSSALSAFRSLRLARIIRCFRVLRVVRSVSAFKEFRLMVIALLSTSAWRSLATMFLMVASFVYLVSLIITSGVGDTGKCSTANGNDIELCHYFGTLDKSALSFYEALYGGIAWGDLVDTLAELGILYIGLFFFLLSTFLLLLGNVCTGVVIKGVNDAVDSQKEYQILEKNEENRRLIMRMYEVFIEADIDGSGTVSATEFDLLVKQPELESVFHILDISTSDAKALFSALDNDDSGEISVEEFVLGCLKIKGTARGFDLFLMSCHLKTLLREAQHIKNILEAGFAFQLLDRNQVPRSHNSSAQLPSQDFVVAAKESHQLTSRSFNILPYPKTENRNCKIKKVEMRAMSLREFYEVISVIRARCAPELWVDQRTGQNLQPEDVNLHHLVHNYVCPATVQDGIILEGVKQHTRIEVGQQVVQRDQRGYQQAEGYVKFMPIGDELCVHVTRGLFKAPDFEKVGTIVVGDGMDCGVPRQVVAPSALSYKEFISGRATKPKWFCSHWWCMAVMEFVMCCEEHAKRRCLDENSATYWVCAYALRQYELRVDVNESLEDTAFWKTLNIAEGVLCVIDTDAVVFKRIWVDFELFVTISDNKKLDMVTVQQNRPVLLSDGMLPKESELMKISRELQFPTSILIKGMNTFLQNGSATLPKDRDRVLKLLFSHFSYGINAINEHLHAFFARAALPQAISRGTITDFDRANPGVLSLPAVIEKDSLCRQIQLSFNRMDKATDLVIQQIVLGIPSNIEELKVNLHGCKNITDIGVASIAEKLPKNLHVLHLNCIGCKNVGNLGLERLAAYLPSTLRELQLDFASCQSIDPSGVKILADRLPEGLTSFRATFQGTRFDRNVMSIDEFHVAMGRSMIKRTMVKLSKLRKRRLASSSAGEAFGAAASGGSMPFASLSDAAPFRQEELPTPKTQCQRSRPDAKEQTMSEEEDVHSNASGDASNPHQRTSDADEISI